MNKDVTELELLLQFANEPQAKVLRGLIAGKSREKIAKEEGWSRRQLSRQIENVRKKARRRGFDPQHEMIHPAPDGFHTHQVSTLYDAEGNVSAQWVRNRKDEERRLDLLLESFKPLLDDLKAKAAPRIIAPQINQADLLSVYPLGDPHVGMHAWMRETGDADFDLKAARDHLMQATYHLVDLAPPSECAYIINLGDYFHIDNHKNQTPASSHALDADTRMGKIFEVGVDVMVELVKETLKKHRYVRLVNNQGNHDEVLSIALSYCLRNYFHNNERVDVEVDPLAHHYYEFGKCLIGTHHGDKTKGEMLPGVMAADRPEAWGRTKWRRWYCGHVHHDYAKDYAGCTVEYLRTTIPNDAYHSKAGYRSGRDRKLDIWHKDRGLINRHIVGIEEVL